MTTPGDGTIIVNPAAIDAASKRLIGLATQIQENFTQAQSTVTELAPSFQSRDGNASRQFYDELNRQAVAFHQAFDSYAKAVGIAGQNLTDVEVSNTSMFARP